MWSSTAFITIGLALFGLSIVLNAYRNYRKCPQVKGPFLASISGLWLFYSTFSGRMYLDCAAAIEKYGSPVRISPDKIVTNDPAILRHMSAPRSNFRRGTWYDSMALDPQTKNCFAQRDEKVHNTLRAKMIRGYSGKDIPLLEDHVDERVVDLLSLIRREAASGNVVDIARLAQYFTLDVLTQIAFGAPFGYVSRNEDVYQYIKEVTEFLHILELGSNFPSIQRILSSRAMKMFRPRPTDSTGLGALLGVAHRVVSERYEPGAKHIPDMLGSFITNGLSQQESENEALLQILGGSDSTATAIRMTFLYILTNPSVYSALVTELESHRDSISSPVIRSSEARNLPYLQSCIKEGLRMWPPLAGLQSKISPPGGETVNGVFIPGGIEVGVNAMTTQRRKEIFGHDSERFRPERWIEAATLDDGGEKLKQMERTVELVFGSGRFGCLGKHVALMELDKVFASLLLAFDWGIVDPVKPLNTICYGVHVQNNCWLWARERAMAAAV